MRRESSKSALFLMELIFAILFFALASAVCLRLFVGAHLVSRDTRDANYAASLTQSAAACVQAEQGDLAAAAALLRGSVDAGRLLVTYDENFQQTDRDPRYALTVTPDAGSETATIAVTRLDSEHVLFSIPVAWHLPLA